MGGCMHVDRPTRNIPKEGDPLLAGKWMMENPKTERMIQGYPHFRTPPHVNRP